jgi:NAD(P)-dependent dehydrogenase (short-subunit alcohol dehydrogenase family)
MLPVGYGHACGGTMTSAFGFDSTAEEVTEGLDLGGTTWLVTGCNSGLGYESARVLAMRGAHLVAAARTREKAAAALAELGVDGLPVACELSDLDSVRAAVATVRSNAGRLDGILANAGIMALPKLEQRNGVELQFLTNHVGHFVLVTGLLDRLTDQARVVMLSSAAHTMAAERGLELDNLSGESDYHPWRMYGRSKLANILFARSLSTRFRAQGSKATANALHPGVIQTNLARHVENAEGMFARMKLQLKTVPQGAATQCFVATHPSLEGVSGCYFSDCAVKEAIPQATDDALAEALWTATERIVAA